MFKKNAKKKKDIDETIRITEEGKEDVYIPVAEFEKVKEKFKEIISKDGIKTYTPKGEVIKSQEQEGAADEKVTYFREVPSLDIAILSIAEVIGKEMAEINKNTKEISESLKGVVNVRESS